MNRAFGKCEEKNVNIVQVIIEIFFNFKYRTLYRSSNYFGIISGSAWKKAGIISGSIWGSFWGWGSFRGRDHFGGCTEPSNCQLSSLVFFIYCQCYPTA